MLWLDDFFKHDLCKFSWSFYGRNTSKWQSFSLNLTRLFNGFLIESQTGNQSLHMPCYLPRSIVVFVIRARTKHVVVFWKLEQTANQGAFWQDFVRYQSIDHFHIFFKQFLLREGPGRWSFLLFAQCENLFFNESYENTSLCINFMITSTSIAQPLIKCR